MFCFVLLFVLFLFLVSVLVLVWFEMCFLWWKSDGRRQGKTRKREKGKGKREEKVGVLYIS